MSVPDEDVTVDADGVSVRKTLNDHQFETLAVVFDIRSGQEQPAEVSITDAIPEGVEEDDIGFHPEYGGEYWQIVAGELTFSRTFEPGEQYTTVYGVREFDAEAGALLDEPSVDVGGAAMGGVESIEDLVAEDDGDLVREVIAGERDGLPGMAEEPAVAGEAPAGGALDEEPLGPPVGDEPSPTDAMAESEAEAEAEAEGEEAPAMAPGEDAGPVGASAGDEGDEDAPGEPADDEPAPVADLEAPAASAPATEAESGETGDAVEAEADEAKAAEPAGEDEEVTVPVTGGIARVLAKELRAGNVSFEDRRLLREELLPDDGSTDARIKRLQTKTEDLAAYTDALEQFLDEEGGAEAVLADVEEQVETIDEGLEAVRDEMDDVGGTVDDLAGSVEGVDADVGDVRSEVGDVAETVEELEDDLASIRDDLDRLDGVDRRVGRVEDDVESIHEELAELATFRDRLSSVFGAGGGADPTVGGADEASDDEADDGDHSPSGGY